ADGAGGVADAGGQVGDDDFGRGGGGPAALPGEARDAVLLGDVEVAVVEGEAVRPEQAPGEGDRRVGDAVAVAVGQDEDLAVAGEGVGDDEVALGAPGQEAGLAEAGGEDGDLEAAGRGEGLLLRELGGALVLRDAQGERAGRAGGRDGGARRGGGRARRGRGRAGGRGAGRRRRGGRALWGGGRRGRRGGSAVRRGRCGGLGSDGGGWGRLPRRAGDEDQLQRYCHRDPP